MWPNRFNKPPETARNGRMWPGRLKSAAVAAGSARARAVRARSCADIPVVVPKVDKRMRPKLRIILIGDIDVRDFYAM